MKRGLRKAVAFAAAAVILSALSLPCLAAENNPAIASRVLLENTYDAAVVWNSGALYLKNGSMDSITDQTEMKLVKPDGSVADFTNRNKFDKIYASLSGADYTCNSSYLIVGKDGKKALLKEDGSFVNDTTYDDIVTASDKYMVLKEGGQFVVRKLDSTLVRAYSNVQDMHLYETDHSLIVTDGNKVIGLFDSNLKEIDLSGYDAATYSADLKNYIKVTFADEVGYIADTGKEIVPPEYTYAYAYSDKGILYFEGISSGNNQNIFTVFSADGTVLFEEPYGYCIDGYAVCITSDFKYGIYDFVNKTNKVDPVYDGIYACNDQYFVCYQNGKLAVKTYDGNVVFESDKYKPNNLQIYISKNYFVINVITDNTDNNFKCTSDVYSIDGKLLFSSDKYNFIALDNEKIIGISIKDQTNAYDLLDEKGESVFSSSNYDAHVLCFALANDHLWVVAKDGKAGMIDDKNNAVVELNYQSLGDFSSKDQTYSNLFLFNSNDQQNYYICTKQNDKFGLIEIFPIVSASGLSLDKTSAALNVGGTVKLTPQFTPADTTDQKVTWSSSDESVATVKDGVVTALKAGTVTITATSENGGLKATCTVQVAEATTVTNATTTNTNITDSTDTTQNSTDPTTTSKTEKSPATGESPVACTVVAFIIASAAAIGLTFKLTFKKK